MMNFEKSEKINEIAMALHKFQGAISGVQKNAKGYGYDYTNMEAILGAIQGPMADNGLSVSQFPINDSDGGLGVLTIVMHTSGQYLQSQFSSRIVDKPDVGKNCQAHGSLITYYRRYALLAALNLASTDDDGASAKDTFTKSKTMPVRPSNNDIHVLASKKDGGLLGAKQALFNAIQLKCLGEEEACKIMKIKDYNILRQEKRIFEIEGYHTLIKAS